MAKLFDVFYSYFCRCTKKQLHLIDFYPKGKPNKETEYVFLFNDYHGFGDIRIKNYQNGTIFTNRKKIIDYFKFDVRFTKILVITVENADDILLFKKNNKKFISAFDYVLFSNNEGRDIGAYLIGVNWVRTTLSGVKKIFIANSSLAIDTSVLKRAKELLQTPFLDDNTVCGMGYGYGPKYVLRKFFHLQSYCIFGSLNAVSCYLSFAKTNRNKHYLIRKGEIEMSKKWLALTTSRILVINHLLSLIIIKNSSWRLKTMDSRFSLR